MTAGASWSSRPESTTRRAGTSDAPQLRRKRDQRAGEDVGEDEIEGRARRTAGIATTRARRRTRSGGRRRSPCAFSPRHDDRARDRCRRRRCGPAGKARAAAMARMPEPQPRSRTRRKRAPPRQPVDGDEAAERRRVMGRAEGFAGLDQDGVGALRHAAPVVAAVDREPSGPARAAARPARGRPS